MLLDYPCVFPWRCILSKVICILKINVSNLPLLWGPHSMACHCFQDEGGFVHFTWFWTLNSLPASLPSPYTRFPFFLPSSHTVGLSLLPSKLHGLQEFCLHYYSTWMVSPGFCGLINSNLPWDLSQPRLAQGVLTWPTSLDAIPTQILQDPWFYQQP